MRLGQERLGLIFAAALLSLPAAPGLAKPKETLENFDIKKEPAKADWRYFLKAPEASREQLWTYHSSQGRQLKDWAWGWRLGWVRACADSTREQCGQIMRQALGDKALVVRAEAATKLGRRFEGSKDAKVVDLLAQAFQNKGNSRNGKPLFVQNRILFALYQIGGDEALARGGKLAAGHALTRSYWTRLIQADMAAAK